MPSAGTTTVDCSATDVAGNESTGSFTVKVQDTIAPTDIQFVGNINDGDSFFFGDDPAEPTCTATDRGSGLQSCVVSGHSTDVGTHTLTATGATSLLYDTTGGQFIYNCKTPTGAGGCYRVTITTNDGSSQTAFFKLK